MNGTRYPPHPTQPHFPHRTNATLLTATCGGSNNCAVSFDYSRVAWGSIRTHVVATKSIFVVGNSTSTIVNENSKAHSSFTKDISASFKYHDGTTFTIVRWLVETRTVESKHADWTTGHEYTHLPYRVHSRDERPRHCDGDSHCYYRLCREMQVDDRNKAQSSHSRCPTHCTRRNRLLLFRRCSRAYTLSVTFRRQQHPLQLPGHWRRGPHRPFCRQ